MEMLPDATHVPLGIPARVWDAISRHRAVIAVERLDTAPSDTVIVCATPEPHISALAGGDVVVDGGISGAAPAIFVHFRPAPVSGEVSEITLDLDLADPHSRAGVWQLVRQEIIVISFVDSVRASVVDQRALDVTLWREDVEGALRAADDYFS